MVSAFVHKYAKISSRQIDKDSMKAVMDLRCLTRSTCTTPWQQTEEAFTPGELQQLHSQLNAGMAAGPDGIAHDLLRHLSTKGSSVLLSILNSSWLQLVPAILVLAILVLDIRGPLPQEGEEPSRRGKLPPDSANFYNMNGLGKTHRQTPVVLAWVTFSSQSLAGRFP